jgi:hypothetical protein
MQAPQTSGSAGPRSRHARRRGDLPNALAATAAVIGLRRRSFQSSRREAAASYRECAQGELCNLVRRDAQVRTPRMSRGTFDRVVLSPRSHPRESVAALRPISRDPSRFRASAALTDSLTERLTRPRRAQALGRVVLHPPRSAARRQPRGTEGPRRLLARLLPRRHHLPRVRRDRVAAEQARRGQHPRRLRVKPEQALLPVLRPASAQPYLTLARAGLGDPSARRGALAEVDPQVPRLLVIDLRPRREGPGAGLQLVRALRAAQGDHA